MKGLENKPSEKVSEGTGAVNLKKRRLRADLIILYNSCKEVVARWLSTFSPK